ncbi:MAG: DEAD/DEAH box helicase [Acidobacteriota bacterium]
MTQKEAAASHPVIARLEWLQIPRDEAAARAPARGESAAGVKARPCERCGWLNPAADPVCFRCDHRQGGRSGKARELHAMGVALPPIEVTLEEEGPLLPRGRPMDAAAHVALRLSAEKLLLARPLEELVSWPTWSFNLYEHQKSAVMKALSRMRGRAILADEVGLGKTIEAGVAMRELMARGLVRTVLVLTPSSLLAQWAEELRTKLGLQFKVAADPEDFTHPHVIASLSLAKGARSRDAVLAREWDLLVVDEAHKVKHRATLAYRFVNAVKKRYALLLTATPIQNDLTELYNLANVLKPGCFGTIRSFKKYHVQDAAWRVPKNPRRLRDLLQEIMIRNRRATVGIDFPARRAAILHLSLSPPERAVYDRVTEYVRDEWATEVDPHYKALSLVTLQRELCSSASAVKSTLERMAARETYPPATRARLRGFLDLLGQVPRDTKIAALEAILAEHPGKFLVYTDFLATQSYIASELAKSGIRSVLYHGSLTLPERAAAIRRFGRRRRARDGVDGAGVGRAQPPVSYRS